MLRILLEQLTKTIHSPDQIQWASAAPGLRICTFDCRFPSSVTPDQDSSCLETLFCLDGEMQIHMSNGRYVILKDSEVLLTSDSAYVKSVHMTTEHMRGVFIAIDRKAKQPCLLDHLRSDTRYVDMLLHLHDGCARIQPSIWSDALFASLQELPFEDRGIYSALKAVEMLYLLGNGVLKLPPVVQTRYFDAYRIAQIQQIHDYVMDHLEDRMTIQQLSVKFRISATLFKQCFRQLYGQTPHRYFTERRMQRAAELLCSSSQSIAQIAGAVGYHSASQFGVVFKQRYHMSPLLYRKNFQKRKEKPNTTITVQSR